MWNLIGCCKIFYDETSKMFHFKGCCAAVVMRFLNNIYRAATEFTLT